MGLGIGVPELVPGEGARDRRVRERPRAVGTCHRAVPIGLVVVDEDALASFLLPPVDGDGVGHPLLELPGGRDDRVPDMQEFADRIDRGEHVDPAVARCLDEGGEPGLGEHRAKFDRDGDGVVEVGTRLRVEVDAQLVGEVGGARAGGPRVEDDRVHLHGPDGGGGLVEHELRMGAPARIGDHDRADELGRALRRVLREELVTVDAIGETLQGERPVPVRGDERVADGDDVLGEIPFGDTGLGPENPVGARDAHLAIADGNGHCLGSHAATVPAGTGRALPRSGEP